MAYHDMSTTYDPSDVICNINCIQLPITFTYVAAVRVIRPYILNSAVPGVQQPSRTTSPAHLDIVKSNNSSMQLCFNTKCIGTVVVEKVTEMESMGLDAVNIRLT